MKLPYIKFIETLIIGRLSPAAIQRQLSEVNIKFPDVGISEVHKQLAKLYPEHFSKEKPPVTPEILLELDIEKMYGHVFNMSLTSGTVGIHGAMEIMNDPLMYRLITSMAIAKITDQDIELIVNGKYTSDYTFEDIKEFLHYFFNLQGWRVNEIEQYRVSVKVETLRFYYKIALTGDKDYLLWKLGASPDKGFPEMIREVMVDSYYNFKDKSKHNSEDAQRWGALMIKLSDRLDKLEKETGKKTSLFDEIIFKIKAEKSDEESPIHISTVVQNESKKDN
jgi:hypothetical protein